MIESNDLFQIYDLLADLTEEKILYFSLKYDKNAYLDLVINLYNLKQKYKSLIVNPYDYLNNEEMFNVTDGFMQVIDSHQELYLYGEQFKLKDRIVFGLKKDNNYHFDYFVIKADSNLCFLDENDAIDYMNSLNKDY